MRIGMGQPYPTHEEFDQIRDYAEQLLEQSGIEPVLSCPTCQAETIMRMEVVPVEGFCKWRINVIAYWCTRHHSHITVVWAR